MRQNADMHKRHLREHWCIIYYLITDVHSNTLYISMLFSILLYINRIKYIATIRFFFFFACNVCVCWQSMRCNWKIAFYVPTFMFLFCYCCLFRVRWCILLHINHLCLVTFFLLRFFIRYMSVKLNPVKKKRCCHNELDHFKKRYER